MSAHAMTVDACSEDLRDLAQRRVPHMVYDLIDCGRSAATPCHANETEFILT
jgi:isopentenyl diphosphate isomerase/L-lactate dehydrogenase-like FMN-dependent dehydrogenase